MSGKNLRDILITKNDISHIYDNNTKCIQYKIDKLL